MGNAAPGTSSPSVDLAALTNHVFVFSLAEDGDRGVVQAEGSMPKNLRIKTVTELVFGSVPLKRDSVSFKVHVLPDLLLCSFITGRNVATCVAFADLPLTIVEGLLVHWATMLWEARAGFVILGFLEENLKDWKTKGTPEQLMAAAKTAVQVASSRFVEDSAAVVAVSSPSRVLASSSGPVLLETLLRGTWPVRARRADCVLAAAVVRALSPAPGRPPILFEADRPPVLPALGSGSGGTTGRRMAASVRAGSAGAIRAQARALALRVQVVTRWGRDGSWQAAGGCAADGSFGKEVFGSLVSNLPL